MFDRSRIFTRRSAAVQAAANCLLCARPTVRRVLEESDCDDDDCQDKNKNKSEKDKRNRYRKYKGILEVTRGEAGGDPIGRLAERLK